jgi:hypothetical protein
MWKSASGAVDNTVRSWVHDLINGLYGFLHLIFGLVGDAWHTFEATALSYWHGLTRFVNNVVVTFYYVIKVLIAAVIKEYRKLFAEAEKFITTVYNFVVRQVLYLIHLIAHSIDSLWQLILRDVYRPLLKFITQAWHWITHEGALVLYYITHPEKLADLLWAHLIAKLEREAWTVGALLGRFFLSLIIHNLKRVALLIEDILDAVL